MDMNDAWGPVRVRTKTWAGALLAGIAAVGWLWVMLRSSSAFSGAVTQLSPLVFAAVVGAVYLAGALFGFLMLRDPRAIARARARSQRAEEREAALEEAREDHDTDPGVLPPRRPKARAPSSPTLLDLQDTQPPSARTPAPRPPAEDDKEYF